MCTTAKDPNWLCECRQMLKLNLKTISPLLLLNKYFVCMFTVYIPRLARCVWPMCLAVRYSVCLLHYLILIWMGLFCLFCVTFDLFVADLLLLLFSFQEKKQCLNNWNLNQTPNTLCNLFVLLNLTFCTVSLFNHIMTLQIAIHDDKHTWNDFIVCLYFLDFSTWT